MSGITLNLATGPYDRVQPLVDGRVTIPGVTLRHQALRPSVLFPRALRDGEFDVFELSASAYLTRVAAGETDLVGIPAFISRAFRHSGIYIRLDRGIRTPADLSGKTIGVPDYAMTGAVWQRGILSDEYGVSPDTIRWVTGGLEKPNTSVLGAPPVISGINLTPAASDQNLSALLDAGEIDALLSSEVPSCFVQGAPQVGRLFPDYRTVEQAYFRKTRLHPIMHLVVLRRHVVEAHPWLPEALYQAFVSAKEHAIAELTELSGIRVTLPWIGAEYAHTQAVLGKDIWPYGIAENQAELDTLIRYANEQGLIERRPTLRELFSFY